ncbi:MAG: hypothetical protein IT304_10550 [Dehalococcoidia bacterium]|nr:hypothetical protein [Dehalococcoidia bacterium]
MLLLADGNNLAWAGFHALRRAMDADSPEARTRAALLGLTQSVLGLAVRAGEPPLPGRAGATPLFRQPLDGLVVTFDEGRPLRRRTLFPGYQMGREANPSFVENEPWVLAAIAAFADLAASLPVWVAQGVNTEADDLIAWLVLHRTAEGARIASSDRDFLQLVDDRVSVYSPLRRAVIDVGGFGEATAPRTADGELVLFPRERYLDYRAASGDASDDLPGIPGVGTLTAARMLAFAPLDDYLEQPRLVNRALGRRNVKLEGALRSGEATAIVRRNRALMDLRLAAAGYRSLDGMLRRGNWDETELRTWLADQRVAGLDADAAVSAMEEVAAADVAVLA